MKDINIAFVNYYTKTDILPAIASLMADIRECQYTVAVTVADNSQNRDHIREALQERFPEVNYADCGKNTGFGQGTTAGFKAAYARYYFALNGDTIIPESSRTIERLIRFMDEHPRVGAIGPKLLNLDGSVQASCYRFDRRSILIKPLKHLNWDEDYHFVRRATEHLLMKDFDHMQTRPVDWVLGAALLVRKEVVDLIGWFDKRYFLYFEDADWCRTMWAHGWPVYYVHDISIIHRHARDSARVPGILALLKNPLARMHAKSWLKFLWKWRKNIL